MNDEQAAAYLAALFDGEGHIGCHPVRTGFLSRSISFCNTDIELIRVGAALLKQLGIRTRLYFSKPKNKKWAGRWTVYIAGGRKMHERFGKLIPLQSKKRAALYHLLSSYIDTTATNAARRKRQESPCEVCGTPVYAPKAFRDRGGGRFCSTTCRGQSQQTRVSLTCTQCSTPFKVIASRSTNAKFCSIRCLGLSQSDRMRAMAKAAAHARWHPS